MTVKKVSRALSEALDKEDFMPGGTGTSYSGGQQSGAWQNIEKRSKHLAKKHRTRR